MRAARFDPAQVQGNCPACGTSVSAASGQQTPPHQRPGSREGCSGAGQPAQ